MNIYEMLMDKWQFKNKTIKLFEAFSGYGSQQMALKNLGCKIEAIGMSDWWITANIAYNIVHAEKKEVDYIEDKEHLIEELLRYGLSGDDKVPMSYNKYERKTLKELNYIRKIIIQNKNYGAIGTFSRLPKDIDICTWSFPCQDISLAGKQKGMVDGSKSNYGYIFLETVEETPYEERPKMLLMENVRALFSETFRADWREIQFRLEKMGYTNYAEILNAKDYGMPQNRDRVFIVSILGEHYYEFPQKTILNKTMKQYLEENVDEKYYLKKTILNAFLSKGTGKYSRRERFLQNITKQTDIANAITTRSGERPVDNFILVPEKSLKGYAEARDGDGIYIDRPHQKGGVVQKGMIQTIKTQMHDLGVVEKSDKQWEGNVKPFEVVEIDEKAYIVMSDGFQLSRIRKLTPREVFRLMGVGEREIDLILSVVTDNQAYKLGGNSIVVEVLEKIFKTVVPNHC
jgi:DNA (cytosine-5)-methyltransferase 1